MSEKHLRDNTGLGTKSISGTKYQLVIGEI